MDGFEIRFNIYAENKEEAEKAQRTIIDFINSHANEGRAVSANKIIDALGKLNKNTFIKGSVSNFLKS